MAQLVITAAATAVGSYFGMPQVGFAVGSYLGGSYAASRKKFAGPRLSDNPIVSASYGDPIPYVIGAGRVPGQVLWASARREVATSTRAGKGGGPTTTTYSYEQDVLFRVAGNVTAGVARMMLNGKVVWTRLTGADAASLANSDGSNLWSRMTVYTGEATQLPDPTYEAAVGAGNAPPYRGQTTVMIQGLQLGSSGQVPNLTFEVVRGAELSVGATTAGPEQAIVREFNIGTAATGTSTFRIAVGQWDNNYATTLVNVYDIDILAGTSTSAGTYNVVVATVAGTGTSDTPMLVLPSGAVIRAYAGLTGFNTGYTLPESLGSAQLRYARTGSDIVFGSTLFGSRVLYRYAAAGGSSPLASSAVMTDYVNSILIIGGTVYAATRNTKQVYILDLATMTLQSTISRPSDASGDLWPRLFDFDGTLGFVSSANSRAIYAYRSAAWVQIGSITQAQFQPQADECPSMFVLGGLLVGGNGVNSSPYKYRTWSAPITLEPVGVPVQEVVEELCARAGMPAGTYDTTGLASITKPVRSIVLTQPDATRGVLDQLREAFFFDAPLSDKLYFRARATASAQTIPTTDLAAAPDEAGPQPFALTLASDLELPAQVALRYSNTSDDYQVGTETSDRLISGQVAQQVVELGLGMTPSEAKAVADAMVLDALAALVTGTISLPMAYAAREPGDVVTVDGQLIRLGRKTDSGGVLTFEVRRHDATATVSSGTTDTNYTPANTVTKAGDTTFLALDMPLARDADDGPGYYVAAKGSTTVWPGGQIHSSADNVTFTQAAEVNESAVFGTCTTTLGNWTGAGMDETNTLTVNVGNGTLSSSTRDAMLADETINAALVGSNSTGWELVRFVNATLVSAGVYTVSRLLRGQKGTEWAMGTHAASESFVLLRPQGMRRVVQQVSETGALRYVKSITLGANAFKNATTFTNTNRGLKPLAPTSIRGVPDGMQGLTITWARRSRLSSRFLASSGVPLGEVEEKYTVRITVGGVLKRAYTVTSSSVTYTRSEQIADALTFNSPIVVTVSQISASVGEGYAGTATLQSTAQSLPQISALTLDGVFEAGKSIRVTVANAVTTYTSTVGDATLSGVATSLAAALAQPSFTIGAVGPVVSISGALGVPFVCSANIVPGDNTITTAVTQQAAASTSATRFEANLSLRNVFTQVNDPLPAGLSLRVYFEQPADTTQGIVQYDPPAGTLRRDAFANLGFLVEQTQLASMGYRLLSISSASGEPFGNILGPLGVSGVRILATSGDGQWALGVTVLAPGGPAVPTALGQRVTFTLSGTVTTGWMYRITLGGTPYSYTAVGGDTMTDIAAGLAALIDPSAIYSATSAGAVVTVEGAGGISYTYSAEVLNTSTMTVAVSTTQEAT